VRVSGDLAVARAGREETGTPEDAASAARDRYDAVLVLDETRSGAFGVAPAPPGLGTPGAGVRDAALLRSEAVTTLAEGAYFRLSAVAAKPSPARGLSANRRRGDTSSER